eukprot:4001013-Prymnesium_polylepis.1
MGRRPGRRALDSPGSWSSCVHRLAFAVYTRDLWTLVSHSDSSPIQTWYVRCSSSSQPPTTARASVYRQGWKRTGWDG